MPGCVRGDKHRIQTGRSDGAVKPGFNLHQAGGFDGVNQAGLQGAKALGEQALIAVSAAPASAIELVGKYVPLRG